MFWIFVCVLFFTAITCFCVVAVPNLVEESKTHELKIEHPILWAAVAGIVGIVSFSMMLGFSLAGFAKILQQ